MRHGKYDPPLDNSDSTFSTGQYAMSASRSKQPLGPDIKQIIAIRGHS